MERLLLWVQRLLGLLAWVSGPAFIAWVSFPSYRSTVCANLVCRQITTSDWQQQPLEVVASMLLSAGTGALLAWLIWQQSGSQSGVLLAAMWLLVPICFLAVYGFAFTLIGSVAFLYGVFTLQAAIAASVVRVLPRWRRETPGRWRDIPA